MRLIVHNLLGNREASGHAGRSLLRRPRQASAHGESRSRRDRASRSKLAEERGFGAEEIAARFGGTPHVVRQRFRQDVANISINSSIDG